MDPTTLRNIMGAAGAGGAAEKIYVEDVFSTWLYTGNGSTQTITNGIDLSGKGGLVWTKTRSLSAINHFLLDTARGNNNWIEANTSDAQAADPGINWQFLSTGYSQNNNYSEINQTSATYASWTFRKAAKFFDVVTYTGTGSTRTVPHNLGSAPGCMIIKRTDTLSDWAVYHRSIAINLELRLNLNAAATQYDTVSSYQAWNGTAPTSTEFSLGLSGLVNASGGTYVAYLFAHDAGGFGDSGNDSVVKCGSYTGNGGSQEINLGWEPQWILIKKTNATGTDWVVFDNMRGLSNSGTDQLHLSPNTAGAEASGKRVYATSQGFAFNADGSALVNGSGDPYIYIAIRRGPMKTPTDATKVFASVTRSGTGSAATVAGGGFPIDFLLGQERTAIGANGGIAVDRLRGAPAYLRTPVTTAEGSITALVSALDNMNGFSVGASNGLNGSGSTYVNWLFRRAPGFFDVVAYTGTGSARTVSHNLGVVPELMIVKIRNDAYQWLVNSQSIAADSILVLNGTSAELTSNPTAFNGTRPTASVFSVGTALTSNFSGKTYIAYLFASCPGVSKVGSYTGTGTTLNIDCGFTAGARFVLIKRTDSTGDWFVWDTARGIIAANDPYMLLNSTGAEVTNTDYIDPLSSGFQISSTAPAAINANGGSFIFLAIA
jgi:hypothetical protein